MTEKEKIAVIYHSLFNYTLSGSELLRWRAGTRLKLLGRHSQNVLKRGKLTANPSRAINKKKLLIAKKAARRLSNIPTVLFVGITGSLAMNNSKFESDIDLMIITKAHSLWITRLVSLPLLYLSGLALRRAKVKEERDMLCLNLWLDETSLAWTGPKNAYIAHEIAQVVPLVNKAHIYESWIESNVWIAEYWPNATGPNKTKRLRENDEVRETLAGLMCKVFNQVCFFMQRAYMGGKVTRETVTVHKAFFHPYDWGKKVVKLLGIYGVVDRL